MANYHNNLKGKKVTNNQLLERGYSKEVLEAMNKEKVHGTLQTCGILFKSDYSNISYPHYDYVVNLYDAYKKGCLPFEGSVSDQPGQIINIFVLLNNLYVETEEKQRKEQESKNKKTRSKR